MWRCTCIWMLEINGPIASTTLLVIFLSYFMIWCTGALPAHMYVTMGIPGAHWGHERVLGSLELELQRVGATVWILGTEPESPGRATYILVASPSLRPQLLFWDRVSHWTLSASPRDPSVSTSSRITGMLLCPASYMASRDWTQIFMLVRQVLYWLSISPAPIFIAFTLFSYLSA